MLSPTLTSNGNAPRHDADRGERGRRQVIFEREPVDCAIYLRTGFRAGDRLEGPAVIEEAGATILVYPGDRMQVNEFGHLVIEVTAGA